jgi:hypothetical protein
LRYRRALGPHPPSRHFKRLCSATFDAFFRDFGLVAFGPTTGREAVCARTMRCAQAALFPTLFRVETRDEINREVAKSAKNRREEKTIRLTKIRAASDESRARVSICTDSAAPAARVARSAREKSLAA